MQLFLVLQITESKCVCVCVCAECVPVCASGGRGQWSRQGAEPVIFNFLSHSKRLSLSFDKEIHGDQNAQLAYLSVDDIALPISVKMLQANWLPDLASSNPTTVSERYCRIQLPILHQCPVTSCCLTPACGTARTYNDHRAIFEDKTHLRQLE